MENEQIFQQFLSKYSSARVAIAMHSRADPDAISSAYALSRLLPNSVICTSEEMSEGARKLSERLGIKSRELSSCSKNDFDGLVVCDTSAYTLLPEAKGWKILFIIDHHQGDGKDMHGEFEIFDRQAPSCAEIIANIVPEIDRETAFGLCVGIIADGARFKSARRQTFETLGRMMKKCDAEYPELLGYAEPEPSMEAKVAMLKAMQKVQYIYSAGYVIATSETSSNEGDSASLLTEAADVAFIAKWKNDVKETRISARARKSCGIALNKVMAEAGNLVGGAGGGHPKAAGAALRVHTDEALKKCVEIFISHAEKQAEGRGKEESVE